METLQRLNHFYVLHQEKEPHFAISTFSTSSSPSASSFTDSQDDLLPDLWLESPSNGPNGQNGPAPLSAMQPLQSANQAFSPNYNFSVASGAQSSMSFGPNTAMLREASLEYAQSLLPHSLLAPLTEENLDYNLAVSSLEYSDDIFNFEQQQAQQQTRPALHNHNCHNHHKSRQDSVSSTSSCKGKNINTQLYKTELCVSFMKMGLCPYGNKCQFAHGEHDLKRVERPANWRSKPCANWAKYGSCRYGKRCCFKHGD